MSESASKDYNSEKCVSKGCRREIWNVVVVVLEYTNVDAAFSRGSMNMSASFSYVLSTLSYERKATKMSRTKIWNVDDACACAVQDQRRW